MHEVQPANPIATRNTHCFLSGTLVSVAALHDAYRQGRSCARNARPQNSEEWRKELASEWARDREARSRCTHYLTQGRLKAQQGDIVESCRLFGLAHSLLDRISLTEEGRLLVRLELSAAEAYLDYCCNDFDQARTRLLESMAAAQELEDRFFHYRLTHLHRVHLINNMAKLEGKAQNLKKAMELAAISILYIQQKKVDVPFPGKWGPHLVRELPLSAVRFITGQAAGDIATLLAGLEPERVREALRIISCQVDLMERNPAWQPEVLEWLQLKILSLDEPQSYLNACVPYFVQGPGNAYTLWHVTAMDVVALCRELYGPDADLFKSEVLADLSKMTFLPRQVQALIRKMQC